MKLIEKHDVYILFDICEDSHVREYNSYYSSLPDKKFILDNFHIIRRSNKSALTIVSEKDIVIGFINYQIKSQYVCTVGITLGKRFWGRGYGKDSIITLANYLFDEKEIEKIEIEVAVPNDRAINCYERCGFTKGKINKNSFKTDAGCFDTMNMHLYKEEFYKENIG